MEQIDRRRSKRRTRQLKHSVNTRHESIFSDHDTARELPTIHLYPRDIMSASWEKNLDLTHSLGTLHTILKIFLHEKCWTIINWSSLHLEKRQVTMSYIYLAYIGFQRCTKIDINIDSLPVHPSIPLSLYPYFSQNNLHMLGKVFKSTVKQPTQEVGSIRYGML